MSSKEFNRLLQKFRTNRDALIKIYNYLCPLIVIHINRSFHGKLDGNDIAQQFFLKLLDMEVKDYIHYPASWAHKISDHIAIDALRKQYNRETAESRAAVKDEVYDPDNLNEMLECLDDKHKEIIYLHYWEGYSLIEISRIMGISYGTLKYMHTKAKEILKDKIEKE